MTVTTTTPPATTAPASAASSASASNATLQGLGSLADNFNTFLTLLTTQLQNQDPTAPLDSNQFTQQLVQMTGVEQQLNTNSLLQQLVTNSTAGGIGSAVSLIGQSVKATSSTATLSGGQAQWTYNLPSAAADLKVQVLDSNNNVVASVAPSSLTAGDHTFSWNGQNLSGTQLPDGGNYTLSVTASDANGNAITATTYQQGVVTGVTQNSGTTSILINGTSVPWNNVVSVSKPAAATSSTTATGS